MKYWFGYLTAAILALITWGVMQLAKTYTKLVDMVYPYLTRTIQGFLTGWSGGVDFLVWQVLLVLLVVLVLASLVLVLVLRRNVIRWLGWVLTVAVSVWFLHTCLWGLNYHAGPLADDIRLNVTEYTLEELEDATIYYRDLAGKLATQVSRDAQGNVRFSDFEDLALQAGEGFEKLTYDRSFSVFAGDLSPVKELGWADMYTSMGITGVTMPITGEAAVNPQIPDVALPFTMCHEMAHRMCIAREQDANFAAFLACQEHSSVEFQYSAYFMAYRYCYHALCSVSTPEAAAAAARIWAGADPYLQWDMENHSAFFREHMDEKASNLADSVNDAYIKTSGDEAGTASYGLVCDMLVSWHIQEVVLPAQQDEAQSAFDPYDEDQVDLSDIVGALEGRE